LSKHLLHVGPDFKQNTWPTKPFDYHGFKENDLSWRLDYIFATKDVRVKKVEIINTQYSDHLPILLEVES